eukprot:813010-Rhodomonas_salina.2
MRKQPHFEVEASEHGDNVFVRSDFLQRFDLTPGSGRSCVSHRTAKARSDRAMVPRSFAIQRLSSDSLVRANVKTGHCIARVEMESSGATLIATFVPEPPSSEHSSTRLVAASLLSVLDIAYRMHRATGAATHRCLIQDTELSCICPQDAVHSSPSSPQSRTCSAFLPSASFAVASAVASVVASAVASVVVPVESVVSLIVSVGWSVVFVSRRSE